MQFSCCPVSVLKNLIVLSAVPPPDESRPCWCVDQDIAFTAAVCYSNFNSGCWECIFHTNNLLSFPPVAIYCVLGDHFIPQTSCECPFKCLKLLDLSLISLRSILLSLEPEPRMLFFQPSAPTLALCPEKVRISYILVVSQICTLPLFVPTAKLFDLFCHSTEVTLKMAPRSQSFVTLLESADHRYTQLPRPTVKTLLSDQSRRFR